MKAVIRAVTVVCLLTAAARGARAEGEGNGDPFPFRAPGLTSAVPNAYAADTGSAAYPDFSNRPSQRVAASGEPTAIPSGNGSEGGIQTANSLPPSFANGTVADTQARSTQRYLAEQVDRAQRRFRAARGRNDAPSG